jgi:hypothetical protein
MALYRCGGGASRLISKNITQNGMYNASDDNADGYSSVSVNVSGGGESVIKTKTEWDSLSFAEKKALGLTVIRNGAETMGEWFDYSNVSLPFGIRGEFYQNSEGQITLPAMDNMIVFQGMWNNGQNNYDNLKFSTGDILYDSKIEGSVNVFYYDVSSPFRKMITILKGTNQCNMNFRNGYAPTGYYSYGAIISIDDPNVDIEILGDYYDGQVHTLITDEAYDGIICITSKGYQNVRVNGNIDLEGAYVSKYDGNEKLYSDASRACIEVYSNVPAGAEITVTTPLGSSAGSAIIGVKNSN